MTNWVIGALIISPKKQTITAELGLYEGDPEFAKTKFLGLVASAGLTAGESNHILTMLKCAALTRSVTKKDFEEDFSDKMISCEITGGFNLVAGSDEFLTEEKFREMFTEVNELNAEAKLVWNLTDHRECQKLDHCIHKG